MKSIFGSIASAFTSSVDLSGLQSVCVFLGPYRNLTTLTSSLLALHPNCQVLNHAGKRVFENEKLNFLQDHTIQKFDAFCQFAISASKKGKRGGFGGSIILSHAFDSPELKEAYKKRFGTHLVKQNIHCLAWKESQRVTNLLMADPKGFEKMLSENTKLRFLLPIRQPLDCAASNLKTNKVSLLQKGNMTDKISFLKALFEEYLWFLTWMKKYPDRFFYFTETTFNSVTISKLGNFLTLVPDPEWEKIVLPLFKVKKNYDHTTEEMKAAMELTDRCFSEFPEFKEDMKRLLLT